MIAAQLDNLELDLDELMNLTTAPGGREELDYAKGVLMMACEVWSRASEFLALHSGNRSPLDGEGVLADEKTRDHLTILELRLDDQARKLDEWEAQLSGTDSAFDGDGDDEDGHSDPGTPVRMRASGSGPIR
jgi:hypothetical protein